MGTAQVDAFDYLRVLPNDAARTDEMMSLRYRIIANLETTGTRNDGMRARIHSTFLPGVRVDVGTIPANPVLPLVYNLDSVITTRPFVRAGSWIEIDMEISAGAYALNRRTATARAELRIQGMEVVDQGGRVVPATICSASGTVY